MFPEDFDLESGADMLQQVANDAFRYAQDELAAHPTRLPDSTTINDVVAAFITALNVLHMVGLVDPTVKQLVVQMARQLIEDAADQQ